MMTAELLTRWYKALYEGDCMKVMELLEEDPSLVLEGWKADPSRLIYADVWRTDKWHGRTALHVGAERGCVDLIKKVLLLFNLEAVRNYGILEEQDTGATQSREEIVLTPGQSDPVESNGVERSGENIVGDDMVLPLEGDDQNGRERAEGQKTTSVHGRSWRKLKMASTMIGLNRKKKDAGNLPGVQSKFDPLDQKAAKEEEIRSEETSAVSGSSKHSINAAIDENDVDNLGSFTRVNLRELLLSKDGTCGLEALAMAGIHYNQDIVNLLIYALAKCDNPPYSIKGEDRYLLPDISYHKEMVGRLDSLRTTTAAFIESLGSESLFLLEEYDAHLDFNFLPRDKYFFHFLSSPSLGSRASSALQDLWERLLEGSLRKFVLELKDGQGRTPFHAAVADGEASHFLELFTDDDREMVICALTARDSAGRSPLHRAACSSRGVYDDVDAILSYCEKYEEVLATCHTTWVPPVRQLPIDFWEEWLRGDSARSGDVLKNMGMSSYGCFSYLGFKPLHAAIIHRRYRTAMRLVEKYADLGCLMDSWYFTEYHCKDYSELPSYKTDGWIHFENLKSGVIAWGLIEFAVLVEANMEFVQDLLKEWPSLSKLILKGDNCCAYDMSAIRPDSFSRYMSNLSAAWRKKSLKEGILKDPWKAVHIAASAGNYEMLRLFTDNSQYDPLIEDFEGNNGLHHAMNVRKFRNFRTHILAFVDFGSVKHELDKQERKQRQSLEDAQPENQKDVKKSKIVEREGCINLLLKVGCDIFQYNKKKQVPDPQGDLIKDGEFCSWWNDKQEKEVAAIQNKLNIASNAISVTAALVATASYVGPLQPPLSYVADPTNQINQIQDDNVWVAIFVFCDTSSFYLAIIAIILALIPSLPMWEQPVIEEVHKTQLMVILAVSFLLPSVACVLIAFASSSMAVVSARLISSIGGRLTIASLCIYAPLIVVAFFLFLVRLLGSLFPRHRLVSYMYKRCI